MEKPIDAVVADLARETASWTSIAARVSVKQVRHLAVGEAGPGTTTGNREEYLATNHGQKKYAQFARVDDREVCVRLGYTDGARSASVRFQSPPNETRQRAITIAPGFLDEPKTGTAEIPAALPFYVGLVPIREAIPRARPVGPSRVLDHACTRYLIEGVAEGGTTQDLVYHLDAATSYPLKVESFANHDRFVADQPTTVWEAVRFDEVGERHVATDSKFTTFIEGQGGRRAPLLTDWHHVDGLRFDEAIPAATFWPEYEPGVLINDRIALKSYKVGAAGQATTQAAAPAVPPRPSAATWAFGVALALGLALLVGGLAARRHRGGG